MTNPLKRLWCLIVGHDPLRTETTARDYAAEEAYRDCPTHVITVTSVQVTTACRRCLKTLKNKPKPSHLDIIRSAEKA